MNARTRRRVWLRARGYCEYCLMLQDFDVLPHHVDHIIARKHNGSDSLDNLALACVNCSLAKGSNIAGRDSRTGKISVLFHPRRHVWTEHFKWNGPIIVGRTIVGRATVTVLNMNRPDRVTLRKMLIGVGSFPPS